MRHYYVVSPDRLQKKVSAFREWVETLTPKQKNLIQMWKVNLTAAINNLGDVSADELIAEVLLVERRKRCSK